MKLKVLPRHTDLGPTCGADLYFVNPLRVCETTDTMSVHPAMCVYSPAFTGTHCAYRRTDGHAELT